MNKAFFITGTDTGVGKTWATIALMRYFRTQGLSVIGMKPVAAGCEWQQGQLKNEDALLIQENASLLLPYELINPYPFEKPVSPHLAGIETPVKIDAIIEAFDKLKDQAEVLIVEGAGGWLAPLNHQSDIADLAKVLQIPVIMVVAIRLGCINHARLTWQMIEESGINCAGWIAIHIDPEMAMQDENVSTIKSKVAAPLLGVFPFIDSLDQMDDEYLMSCGLTL